jgi:hypothetical protein
MVAGYTNVTMFEIVVYILKPCTFTVALGIIMISIIIMRSDWLGEHAYQ